MTAVVVPSMNLRGESQSPTSRDFPPINFVYKHLHDSIREELAQLSSEVQAIEGILHTEDVTERLVGLRKRYQMLVQVNRYHSSVEDEVRTAHRPVNHISSLKVYVFSRLERRDAQLTDVKAAARMQIVYPAVEYKVQNVTHSYSVEHGEEDLLLDSLQHLIESAINADASERDGFVHELQCKVEEVHVTLQKHLRKEEDQLFPLLLQHFTFSEQADLVVQFICCIPVMSARSVLNWLRNSTVCNEEQVALRQHVARVTVDPHLRRLITHWLQPTSQTVPAPAASTAQPCSSLLLSRSRLATNTAQPHHGTTGPVPEPLDTLVLLHRGLLHTLEALTGELQQLALCGRVSAKQIHSVVQRWQFLCTVSAFHRVSEDEFVFPMARALGLESSAAHCAQEHWDEAQTLTKLGRLLNELESCTRRNAANVAQLLKELVSLANDVSAAMKAHLAREEQDVLPALRRHLTRCEKHAVVWKSLQALPLRLLERIMPWVALHIGTQGLSELMRHPAEGEDPVADTVLVQLLSKWSQRAFSVAGTSTPSPASPTLPVINTLHGENAAAQCSSMPCQDLHAHEDIDPQTPAKHASGMASPPAAGLSSDVRGCTAEVMPFSSPPHSPMRLHDDPHLAFHISTCAPALVRLAPPHRGVPATNGLQANGKQEGSEGSGGAKCSTGKDSALNNRKRRRTEADCTIAGSPAHSAEQEGDRESEQQKTGVGAPHNPIDHIFQFHKALRRELHQIEFQARTLQAVCQDPQESASTFDLELQRLSGRFLFVQGIYQAHSVSEDEVVFPALEAKHTLRNVSKFYVLDHEHETQLFAELQAIIHSLQQLVKKRPDSSAWPEERDVFKSELSGLVGKLRLKCASVRASLETHVKAEEAEIWPLFSEHFTVEEQSTLVGTIIGRTGAVVLQALIPWVMNSFSHDETHAMMDSLRSAAKNTRFDQWLESMVPSGSTVLPADVEVGVSALADAENVPECHSPHAPPLAAGHDSAHPECRSDCAIMNSENAVAVASCHLDAEASGCSAEHRRLPGMSGACAMDVHGPMHDGDAPASVPATVPATAQLPAVPNVLHRPSEKDSSEYRPGWVDIFRMNASQLESAAAHSTPNDKHRDSYLAHHLMVSRFLVAQQQRMHSEGSELGSAQSTQQLLNTGLSAQSTCTSGMAAGALASTAAPPGGGSVSATPSTAFPVGAPPPGGAAAGATPPTQAVTATANTGACRHYEKNCNLVAPCCGVEVACRLCHDEQMTCSKEMDRYKVSEMVCQACGKKQPCSEQCVQCHTVMARYYCGVCHLFDDTRGRDIYHCPFCNMCRRGKGLGIDAFHCMRCNACMSLDLFNNHTCREHAMESNCPICHEDLFESSIPVKELPCGHFMHSTCFMQHTQHRYTCPICFKTAGDLTLYFQMLDRLLCNETMPEQLANLTQNVQCNDCSTKATVKYHFVYHKCPSCSSYNTRPV